MQFSLTEIFVFTNLAHLSPNFLEGERSINAGYVTFCRKLEVEKSKLNKFILYSVCEHQIESNRLKSHLSFI